MQHMASNRKQKEEEPPKLEQENKEEREEIVEDDDDNDEEEEEAEGWDDWEGDEGDSQLELLCLFCDSKYGSCDSLFQHCASTHYFDFHAIRKALSLDFYASFKLINYIRSQVSYHLKVFFFILFFFFFKFWLF